MIFNFFKKKKETEGNETTKPLPQPQPPVYEDQIRNILDAVSNLSKSVKNIEGKLYEFSEKMSAVEEKTKIYEEEISNLKNDVEKMISIYDLLTRQYNPFLEEDVEKAPIEPEIQESSEKLSSEGILPLDKIENDPALIAVIIGWLNYLVKKGGIKETEKALDFYEEVGWITEEVKIKLLEYLKGFENVETNNESIGPEDHILTLYIISKIKSGEYGKIYRIKDLYNELVKRGIIKPNKI